MDLNGISYYIILTTLLSASLLSQVCFRGGLQQMADHTWSGKKHEKTTHVASNSQTSTVLPSCANMYYLLVPQISEKQLKEPLVVPGNCWNIMLVIHNNCSNAKCEGIDIYTYTMILCASINIQPGLSHKHQKATPSRPASRVKHLSSFTFCLRVLQLERSCNVVSTMLKEKLHYSSTGSMKYSP